MTQAKRIKPKRTTKPKAKVKKPRQSAGLPWGLMLVILLCGVVLGLLMRGSQDDGSTFGSGLKAFFEPPQVNDQESESIADLIKQKGTDEKNYDFYTLLPEIEKLMPDDLPESEPTKEVVPLEYYLQAASFRDVADAEKLRARLGLQGYQSVTQARDVADKGTFYRVRLGPYPDKRKAKTAKNKLRALGVNPLVYSVKK